MSKGENKKERRLVRANRKRINDHLRPGLALNAAGRIKEIIMEESQK